MKKTLVAILVSSGISGCSVFGQSQFSCNAPDGVSCQSISGGYANALSSNIPGQKQADNPALTASVVKSNNIPQNVKPSHEKTFSSDEDGFSFEDDIEGGEEEIAGFDLITVEQTHAPEGLLVKQSAPLRAGEEVMRVAVFPWADDQGVLHDLSTFYFVVKESNWNVEHTTEVEQKSFERLGSFRGLYGSK